MEIVMGWSRQKSNLEELMVDVLKKKKKPLTLYEVVEEIRKNDPEIFTGKTPTKSLYSTIYRREKARAQSGNPPFFLQDTTRRDTLYSLNPEAK